MVMARKLKLHPGQGLTATGSTVTTGKTKLQIVRQPGFCQTSDLHWQDSTQLLDRFSHTCDGKEKIVDWEYCHHQHLADFRRVASHKLKSRL